jgi:hypothetical protein
MICALFFVGVLSNIAAVERLWSVGRIMREREVAAAEQAADLATGPTIEFDSNPVLISHSNEISEHHLIDDADDNTAARSPAMRFGKKDMGLRSRE